MSVAVSVIVPVYNTARYLNQCIDSLIRQTLKDVEFIFVDDGSTDSSPEILKQYQKKDSRIKVIQQKNQYAGAARNRGMEEASGKYLSFLDSDDYFDPDMLKKSYLCAEKHRAEIVLFGYREYHDGLKKITERNLNQGRFFPKGVFTAEALEENLYQAVNPQTWNKLFLREFVEARHLRFEVRKKCNDAYFTYMALPQAARMVYLDKNLVTYRVGNAESTQGKSLINTGREAFIDVGISVKRGLTEIGKYSGAIKKSETKYAMKLVRWSFTPPYTGETLQNCYLYAKEQLIPGLFDSPGDFEESYTAKCLYASTGFTDFLCRMLEAEKEDKKQNYTPKSSLDVRVGTKLLAVPRRIYAFLKGY